MIRVFLSLFLITSIAISCSQNALTGKSQFTLLPESQLQEMANQQYTQFLSANKVVASSANKDAEMVKRVGRRVTAAVESYYQQKGISDKLQGFNWEYNLVNDPAVNAWCMPGGKIVVYTGLLPITQNEAALAVVMGHEVAHALLQHGNQRMSTQMGAQAVQAGLQVALANKSQETQNLFMTAYGVGAQVGVMLPFSRKHELQADQWGLNFTAMAGYNPREAIPLWERMEKAGSGQKPPEFLSTHPSEGQRRDELNRHMPEALKYYKPIGK
jgi:predicted Zn-dependent protease